MHGQTDTVNRIIDVINVNVKPYYREEGIYQAMVEQIGEVAVVGTYLIGEINELQTLRILYQAMPDEFKDTIDSALIFADGEKDIDRRVSVSIRDGIMLCKGEKDAGWIEIKEKVEFSGDIEFVVNPIFMSKILDETQKMYVGDS